MFRNIVVPEQSSSFQNTGEVTLAARFWFEAKLSETEAKLFLLRSEEMV